MTYAYGGDPTGLTGAYHYGGGGLGVLGSLVASTGEAGAGYGFNSLTLPADANKEYCFPLGAIPAGLTIDADELTGFTASATTDGTYSVPFRVIEGGIDIGASSFSLTFGAPAVVASGANCTQVNSCSTGAITVTPAAAGVVNLAGSNCAQPNACSTGAVTVIPRGTMSFVPSAARTIAIQAAPGAFGVSTSGFWITTDPKKPRGVKDPDSTIDVTFDWTAWLADIQDTAASFSFPQVGGGLVNVGDQQNGPLATIFVSGGTVGGQAAITCRITSSSVPPRIEERTVYLNIEER